MGSEWPRYLFEDCMDAIIDYRGKTPRKTDSGIPLITAKIIKNGTIQPVTEYIAESNYDSWMRRGIPEAGDVVLTTEAPLGEVAQLDNRKIALAQRVITLRGKKGFLDNTFLRYLLLSNDVQHQLDGRGTGTTVKGIKQSELRKVELPIPAYGVQQKIAHILVTVDNKIQLNRQTNQTLEAMAQALFKSWFVDFDPVFDNAIAHNLAHNNEPLHNIPEPLLPHAERRLNVHNVGRGSARQTAAQEFHHLFPQTFEQSDEPSVGIQGWVPQGWGVKNITELADTISNTYPLKTVDKVIFLNTGDIEAGNFLHKNYSEASTLPGQAKKMIQKDDILYSEIRPKNKRFAYVYFDGTEHVVSTKLMVLRAKEKANSRFVYFLLTLNKTIFDLQRIAELRSGTFPQITYNELSLIKAAIPSDGNVLKAFSKIMLNTYYNKNLQIQAQNEELKNLRDTLLPKLISGELRIPDAQQSVEALIK